MIRGKLYYVIVGDYVEMVTTDATQAEMHAFNVASARGMSALVLELLGRVTVEELVTRVPKWEFAR